MELPPEEQQPAADPKPPQALPASSVTPPAQQQSQSTRVDSDAQPLMTPAQLNERIAQAKRSAAAEAEARHKAWLLEKYGTDVPEKIEEWHAQQKALAEAEEKRKREAMSEREKLQADLEAERKATAQYKQQLEEAKRQAAFEKQNSAIRSLASNHVDSRYVDAAMVMLARHVRSLPPNEKKSFGPKQTERWFVQFVKDQPAFGKEQEKAKRREPVTTGASPAEMGQTQPKPLASADAAGKTLAPGHPNSMSDKEARDYMRKMGWQY